MINPRTLLLAIYVVEAAAMIGLSIPLILGRIRPNSWYGFRVKRTLADPTVWYAANRYAARQTCALGLMLLVVAVSLYFFAQLPFTAYAISCLAATLLGLAVVLIRSFHYLHQLPR